jgi:hypothetical protein
MFYKQSIVEKVEFFVIIYTKKESYYYENRTRHIPRRFGSRTSR